MTVPLAAVIVPLAAILVPLARIVVPLLKVEFPLPEEARVRVRVNREVDDAPPEGPATREVRVVVMTCCVPFVLVEFEGVMEGAAPLELVCASVVGANRTPMAR